MTDVHGGFGNDTLSGGMTSTNVYGNGGNDFLTGFNSGGSDRKHRLTGGEGADTFEIVGSEFTSNPIVGSNAVEILDYNSAEDQIVFGTFNNEINNVENFYTVHYGTGDSTLTFIHDGGSNELVAAVHGDFYEISAQGPAL